MRTRLALAILLSFASAAQALQIVEVADGETVPIQVSSRELTRIGLADGGRLVRVWGSPEAMQVEADPEAGQVFLRLPPGEAHRPFSFFVRDNAGATYTLLAAPVDRPAETVLIRPKGGTDKKQREADLSLPYIERIQRLIRDLVQGSVPPGYEPQYHDTPVPLGPDVSLRLRTRYRGDRTAEVYRLENASETELTLDERAIGGLARDIQAVTILDHRLAPGAATTLYLVRGSRREATDGE